MQTTCPAFLVISWNSDISLIIISISYISNKKDDNEFDDVRDDDNDADESY